MRVLALLSFTALAACATDDDLGDPAATFGLGKADGAKPPLKAWLPLEKPETLSMAFSDGTTSTEMVYAEFALSGPATVHFEADTVSLYIYDADGDGWGYPLAKHRSKLSADLDAGTYRLLLRRRDDTASVDLTTGCDGDGCIVYPAFPVDMPQIVNVKGGPTFVQPRLIAVTFDGDAYRDDVETYLGQVAASDYWTQTTAEYGVGAATVGDPVHLSEAAPASLDHAGAKTWLAQHLDGTHPEWGTPDAHAFYIVFFPETTQLDLDGAKGCTGFGGYHESTVLGDGTAVIFAAMPRCATFNGFMGLDALTMSTSHELIEGVTDPFTSQYAFALPDDDHFSWSIETGGEAGDMCAAVPGANTHVPDISYVVQRTWSNLAAKAGADPCVPHVASEPYVVATPVLDHIMVKGNPTTGVQVPVGETRTIEVDLSTAGLASKPFDLKAVDGNFLKGQPANLELTFDKPSGDNGDRVHLTIKTLAADPKGFSTFIIAAQTDATNASLMHGFVAY
jgi:hypothetical protein